jgi:RNA polymerase sigma-70 factor (ECF subfamily)
MDPIGVSTVVLVGEEMEKADPKEGAQVLVENHREFLAFLERRVGDRALAEDILQDAFVRSLDKLGTVQKRESVVAWFYRSLRNAVVDHWRRRGASERALAVLADELREEQPAEEVGGEVCRCVLRLADTLKPEYGAALRRIDVEGVPVKDFAREAGITSGNAGVRVFRARDALRRQVARSCGTCATHGCIDCTCG